MEFIKIVLLSLAILFTTPIKPHYKSEVIIPIFFSQNYEVINIINWTQSDLGYWIVGYGYNLYSDFDWMVTRSVYSDTYGYYYYDLWFFSQSYYWDGVNVKYCHTNIREITVSIDVGKGKKDVVMDMTPMGITFDESTNAPTLRFKSTFTNPYIWIKWGKMVGI